MDPKVSICIPAYKQPDSILRTLKSIGMQDFLDFEVVVSDDTPDDSVYRSCEKFFTRFPIKYLRNDTSLGSPGNWNRAVAEASGEYIKIMHHDDYFADSTSLGAFVALLDEHPGAGFAFSGSNNVDKNGLLCFVHSAKQKQVAALRGNHNLLFFGNFVGAPSATIYRRDLGVRFDENLKWVVDLDFYYAILRMNSDFCYTEKPLVSVCVGGDNRVTSECENNKCVEIYEWFYFYKKLISADSHDFCYFKFFWNLLGKYKVSSFGEISACGVNAPVPGCVEHILYCLDIFNRVIAVRILDKLLCGICFRCWLFRERYFLR
jgi:glycosyltransferase involved in cell wall biosynthesis